MYGGSLHFIGRGFLVSQFANVDVAITFIKDEFGHKVLPYLRREELVTLVICAVGFILGIPHVTKVCTSNSLTRLTTSSVFSP